MEGKKVILYAGRLSANKGIDVLVRAMPALAEKHDNIALVIMGSKWFSNNDITDYVAYVRALAERLPVTVIQTGFVAPDKIQEWFAASDIFVCTSQWQEPLARVHYEAMASALPIVTTNRGGNTEVIEPHKNGIIVENPAEPGEFAQHLSYLLSNPGVGEEMGRYGRSLAEKHYTWDRVVSDILSAWQQVERSELLDVAGLEHVEEYQAAEAPIAEMNAAGISPAAEELFEEEAVEAVGEDNLVEEVIESLETEGTSAPEAEMETVEEVEESETVEEESEQLVSEPEADAEEAETPAGEMEADPVEEVEESETVKEESEQLVSEPEADAEEAETPAGEMEADPVEEVEEFETVEEESEQLVSEPEADAEEIETPAAEAEAEPVEKAEESETVKEELEEVAVDSVEEEVEESEPATTVNPLEEKLVAFTNVIRGALGNQGAVQRKSKKSPPSRENSNALNTNNKDHATNLFILLALFYMREKKWI
ncbi:glycosyltransferase family 4 protein [Halobacillus andaensis]|uniref:glycosyltransferase family 4 protein n=1 Tax=Halobacillus andaensis TaxID=1176239 RepID=UPI003D718617